MSMIFRAIGKAAVARGTATPVSGSLCGGKKVTGGVVGFAEAEYAFVLAAMLSHLFQGVDGLGLYHALCSSMFWGGVGGSTYPIFWPIMWVMVV